MGPLTEVELMNYIALLKNNSSPGHDGIQVNTIKQTHREIINPLLHIYNLILENGSVPTQFKTSIITPIHKSGSKTLISNYRPISLISNFAKLFEKCIKTRLIDFLRANHILLRNQYGFLGGCSTADAMHAIDI